MHTKIFQRFPCISVVKHVYCSALSNCGVDVLLDVANFNGDMSVAGAAIRSSILDANFRQCNSTVYAFVEAGVAEAYEGSLREEQNTSYYFRSPFLKEVRLDSAKDAADVAIVSHVALCYRIHQGKRHCVVLTDDNQLISSLQLYYSLPFFSHCSLKQVKSAEQQIVGRNF